MIAIREHERDKDDDAMSTDGVSQPPRRYERPGDKNRPSLYVTSATLVHQTATEVARYNRRLNVCVIGSKNTASGLYEESDQFPTKDDTLWDTNIEGNLNTILVVSYNFLAAEFGPQAMRAWIQANPKKFCEMEDIPFEGFNARVWLKDPRNPLPKQPQLDWYWLTGRFCYVFADEAQEGLRNFSSFWRTIDWLKPVQLFLMSGYPAPRGMQDFHAMLKLIARPEFIALGTVARPGYVPGETDPYSLADNDPK